MNQTLEIPGLTFTSLNCNTEQRYVHDAIDRTLPCTCALLIICVVSHSTSGTAGAGDEKVHHGRTPSWRSVVCCLQRCHQLAEAHRAAAASGHQIPSSSHLNDATDTIVYDIIIIYMCLLSLTPFVLMISFYKLGFQRSTCTCVRCRGVSNMVKVVTLFTNCLQTCRDVHKEHPQHGHAITGQILQSD